MESHLLREPNPKIFRVGYMEFGPARFAHSDASARSPPIFRKTLVKRFGLSEEEANSANGTPDTNPPDALSTPGS